MEQALEMRLQFIKRRIPGDSMHDAFFENNYNSGKKTSVEETLRLVSKFVSGPRERQLKLARFLVEEPDDNNKVRGNQSAF